MDANKTEKTMGYGRHEKWNEVREAHLAEFPKCAMCDVTGLVEVHHLYPFYVCRELGRADLELDRRNLVTLCEGDGSNEHHFLIGHLSGWESFNSSLKADLKIYKDVPKDVILKDRLWRLKSETRYKAFKELTPDKKAEIQAEINRRIPVLHYT